MSVLRGGEFLRTGVQGTGFQESVCPARQGVSQDQSAENEMREERFGDLRKCKRLQESFENGWGEITMKHRLAWMLLMLAVAAGIMTGCSAGEKTSDGGREMSSTPLEDTEKKGIELTLWTYPVGGWGSGSTVSSMVTTFHREHPDIRISVQVLNYVSGDEEIEKAIAGWKMPDLVFEGPERLTANWGARGLMADLSDLWESETAGKIYDSVEAACRYSGSAAKEEKSYFIYPVCMTTHCMAINRDLFEASGAWQYIDEETHTWSTEDFINAVKALRDYGMENVAAVYCGGQGGDQGTRALVNNLYSGTFTDPDHTRYTVNSPENIQALELLFDMDGIVFDDTLQGADELEKFCKGELAMSFCWNVAQEVTQTISNPDLDFDIFPMAFPTNDGEVNLQGGIWGFGIFDNGDPERIEAAKTFIRFMTENESQYTQAVLSSTFWPVRDIPSIYENDELMTEYSIFQQYLGDYYQITPGWTEARTVWWNMLQKIGAGEDIETAVESFEDEVFAQNESS